MISLLDEKREDLIRLCQKYRVRRLEVFGSAANGEFDSSSSDLDFLVEYLDLEPGQHAEAYFNLSEALEALFHRPVDLVMTRAIKNRYFLEAIESSRTLLYAN